MVWRLLLVGPGLMELRIILQQVLFTSCAAGTSTYPALVARLIGTLASTGTIGRRGAPLRVMMARPSLAVTASASVPLACSRRLARMSAGTVSPSAALVLY